MNDKTVACSGCVQYKMPATTYPCSACNLINSGMHKSFYETAVPPSNAENLAEAHWGYIQGVLEHAYKEASGGEEYVKEIGYHYKTAFVHGWKHAKEEG